MADIGSKTYRCSLITPDRQFYDGEAVFTAITAADGELGILADHAPMVARLGTGAMRVHSPEGKRFFFVGGGFAEMNANMLTVLAAEAECLEGCTLPEAESQYRDACCMSESTPQEAELKRQSVAKSRALITIARDLAGM
jgi:F-type H+-transporting ATPase subunit epsilon